MQLAVQATSCDYYRGSGVEKMVFAMFVASFACVTTDAKVCSRPITYAPIRRVTVRYLATTQSG